MSNHYGLTEDVENAMASLIGKERLAPYLAFSNGDQRNALELYVWNAALASAFLGPLGILEVALRNKLNTQLEAKFKAPWYEDPNFVNIDKERFRHEVELAKAHIARARPVRSVSIPNMVAQLRFSFWVSVLKPAYSRTLWPIVGPAFLKYTHRKSVMRHLEPLVTFRNRIAHHEPIHNRRPHERFDSILFVAKVLDPYLSQWIERQSRVRHLLSGGPVPPRIQF